MAKNITLAVPDGVYALMKEHSEINWSAIAKKSIEAFAKILEQADEAEKEIANKYGNEVTPRFSMGISDNSGVNRFPVEAGMMGYGYSANINFSMNVMPTRQPKEGYQKIPNKKDILKEATKS